jgi:hypothetical protein
MKTFAGWAIVAGVLAVPGAGHAQVPEPYVIEASPYAGIADFDGPYAAAPVDEVAPPAAAAMLQPREVFRIVRANGFAPRGGLRLRGRAYRIVVIDADGAAGRLVIDAYSGRIRRFVPVDRVRAAYGRDVPDAYDRFGLPAETAGPAPRPPARIPHVASLPRAVPLPKEAPRVARTEGDIGSEARRPVSRHKSESTPAARTAAAHAGTVGAATSKPSSADTADKKPDTPEILPTQPMPPVQGLD